MPRKNTLRAMSDPNIRSLSMRLRESEVRTKLSQPTGHLLSSAYRRGRLQNDKISLLQYRRDRFAGSLDKSEIRLVLMLEWGGNGNKECVGRLRIGGRTQITLRHGGMHHHVQIRFDDMNLSSIDGINRRLIDVNTNHFFLSRSENSCSGKTYVTKSNHGNSLETHQPILSKIILRLKPTKPEQYAGMPLHHRMDYGQNSFADKRTRPSVDVLAHPQYS